MASYYGWFKACNGAHLWHTIKNGRKIYMKQELKKYTDAKIDYLDERLTSVSAEKILISADVSRKRRKEVLDKLSATIILQDYLDGSRKI